MNLDTRNLIKTLRFQHTYTIHCETQNTMQKTQLFSIPKGSMIFYSRFNPIFPLCFKIGFCFMLPGITSYLIFPNLHTKGKFCNPSNLKGVGDSHQLKKGGGMCHGYRKHYICNKNDVPWPAFHFGHSIIF